MSANTSNKTGQQGEDSALNFLAAQGLSLMERNYRSPRGEIDLIMKDQSATVFIEVRFRSNTRYGSGAESVNRPKQEKLLATAAYYLQKNPKLAKGACRFDVISLTVNNGKQQLDWITDAFQA